MPAVRNNDAELVAACLDGNRDAFGQIVSRYQSLICSLAYSATGCLGQSEDLAQEFALGRAAFALHANDEVAKAAIHGTPFSQHAQAIMAWTGLRIWMPMGLILWQALRLRKAAKSAS